MEEAARQSASFPVTRWSVIAQAGIGDDAAARDALEHLLRLYMPALRAHLMLRRGLRQEEADDLLQSFIASRVLGQRLLSKADRARGRFRSFLLTSLDNFTSNHFRHAAAARRSPGRNRLVSLDHAGDQAADAKDRDAFDTAWARQVLEEALKRMAAECAASGREDLWTLFQGRVVAPAYDDAPPLGYEEMIRRFGFASPAQAANALVTAKRMFARMLRSVVSEYAEDGADAEEEIRQLQSILARRGG